MLDGRGGAQWGIQATVLKGEAWQAPWSQTAGGERGLPASPRRASGQEPEGVGACSEAGACLACRVNREASVAGSKESGGRRPEMGQRLKPAGDVGAGCHRTWLLL